MLSDIHLIFDTLFSHTKLLIKFEFGFGPLIFHEVMALGLSKISRIVSFLHFCSTQPPLPSQIVTNQNLALLCLNYFRLNYTVGKGLGIARNTLRMLGVLF
jgi:hypothetical protein